MQAHISSVKALCVTAPNPHSSSRDLLLFSAGGRAQLNAWRIYFREGSDGSGTQGCDRGKKSQGARGVGCDGVCVTNPGGEDTERTVGWDDSHAAAGERKAGGKETVNTDAVTCHVRPVNQIDDNVSMRTADNMPTRTDDNMPTRIGDNMPTRTGDNMPTRTGDNMPTRTGNNMPTTTGDNMPTRTGDNMPTRTGDNMPTRTGDNMPTRTGDNMPTRTGDNIPCAWPKDRAGNNLSVCDIPVPGSSLSHMSVPTIAPESCCEHVTQQPLGGSTVVTGGTTCWHKHLAGHMLLQNGHRGCRKSWKTVTCDTRPETRFMSVCVVSPRDLDPSICPLVHVLTTACSDGYVR